MEHSALLYLGAILVSFLSGLLIGLTSYQHVPRDRHCEFFNTGSQCVWNHQENKGDQYK